MRGENVKAKLSNNKKRKQVKHRKFSSKYLYLLVVLVIIGIVAIVQTSYSLKSSKVLTTGEYVSSIRNSGNKINKIDSVKVDKLLPDDYSFAVNYDVENSNYKSIGGIDLGTTERQKWEGSMNDSIQFYSDDETKIGHETDLTSFDIRDGSDQEFAQVYSNIGVYQGKNIDLILSIADFEITNQSSSDEFPPFIGFYDPTVTNRIGVYAGNVNWVELKYEFCEHKDLNSYPSSGAVTCDDPVSIKGHITYNDVDLYQGVHILNNSKDIYARSNSDLYMATASGTKYIYNNSSTDLEGLHNPKGSFTETFEGNTLNRVYTFGTSSSSAKDASGVIWNTDVISGASVEYAKDTANGYMGKAVKKNDVIRYTVTYTNDSLEDTNTITIKSILSKGLEYIKGSSSKVGNPSISKNNDGTSTLTWKVKLDKNSVDSFTYGAKVIDDEVGIVSNKVNIKSSNGSEYSKLDALSNSVPRKAYDSSSKAGLNGTEVSVGDKIKYNIKYANIYNTNKVFTITETLSKHLKYVSGSANLGEPVITKNSDGTTKLVWSRNLSKNTEETLTYSVVVLNSAKNGDSISSSTVLNIPGEGNIKLGKLSNKVNANVEKDVPKEVPKEVPKNSPGTGSVAVLMRDSYNGSPIKNTSFALYNADTVTLAVDAAGNQLQTLTTDFNGVVQWNNVLYGNYVLKEVTNSDIFKTGFYEVNKSNEKLVNSISFEFNADGDAMKWYNAGKMTGGINSGESFIERDNAKLGDLNDDGVIDNQDLILIGALYDGTLTDVSSLELKKYMVAADVDNDGKCNDDSCKITKSDINLLKSYIENPKGNQFEAFKVVYLKDSYQRKATVSLLGIPLDLKISNMEYDTSKELKDAKFVIKDSKGNVYHNITFDNEEEQVYLPIGKYVMIQEDAKNGYAKYENGINFEMTSNGDINLLTEEYDFVKVEKSKDGNIDHLIVYNKLSDYEVRVPFLDDSDSIVPKIVRATGGVTLIIGSAAAVMYRYGVSYKVLASRLTNFVK